ncbi:MAG TPA: FeoA family protein [Actinomycetaceae bacterium]|nr:FeoA family protein [Actinomycetaceae bacterium]
MSQLSERLRRRDINGACRRSPGHHASIADLAVGEGGRVCGVCDLLRPDAARRLVDLGFIPGTTVVKQREDAFGKTMVVDVAGCELALRNAQARCITVEVP